MSSPSDATAVRQQKFYAIGKRIPKDVKRHCGMCRQHGLVVETRGHVCTYRDCECDKCSLVRKRRSIMSTQIRLRREQDKRFRRASSPSDADVVPSGGNGEDHAISCYFCQKCKNHGVLMWKKDHKKHCEYANCRCEQCDLIDTRRALDRTIKTKKGDSSDRSTVSPLVHSSLPNSPNHLHVPTLKISASAGTSPARQGSPQMPPLPFSIAGFLEEETKPLTDTVPSPLLAPVPWLPLLTPPLLTSPLLTSPIVTPPLITPPIMSPALPAFQYQWQLFLAQANFHQFLKMSGSL